MFQKRIALDDITKVWSTQVYMNIKAKIDDVFNRYSKSNKIIISTITVDSR